MDTITITLPRAEAFALLDRVRAAEAQAGAGRRFRFTSAATAIREALLAQSASVEVPRPAMDVEVVLTEEEAQTALRCAIRFGSGRPVV
jgi:hypothetical protein